MTTTHTHTTAQRAAAHALVDALSLLALDMPALARATRNALGGHGLPAQYTRMMFAESGPICAWCGGTFALDALYLAHLIPAADITPGARGGARGGYVAPNLALSCYACNEAQGDDWADPFTMAR